MADDPRDLPDGDGDVADPGDLGGTGAPAADGEAWGDASPYPTQDIRYLLDEGEALAVLLRGLAIGKHTIPTKIAGPFLLRLHELVHALASTMTGGSPGARGKLPHVEDAGFLALSAFTSGASVTFHFEIGPGEIHRIGEETSITQRAIEVLTGMIEACAKGDADTLLDNTRELGQRVGANFTNLVKILADNHVESEWQPFLVDTPIRLGVADALRAHAILEEEARDEVEELILRGWLYRTDAKNHQFLFEPADAEALGVDKLVGEYGDEAREQLREAWDREVTIRVVITRRFLRRQKEPTETTIQLVEVLEVVD